MTILHTKHMDTTPRRNTNRLLVLNTLQTHIKPSLGTPRIPQPRSRFGRRVSVAVELECDKVAYRLDDGFGRKTEAVSADADLDEVGGLFGGCGDVE